MLTLPNNRIASCARTIKIWKSNLPYSDTPIIDLAVLSNIVITILYVKEKDILISLNGDKSIDMWNMTTYKKIGSVNPVCAILPNQIFLFDKDRLIIGRKNGFCVVDIDKCEIETKVKDEQLGFVKCFMRLRDNKTIVCGCDNGIICLYNINTGKYTLNDNTPIHNIAQFLRIDDNTFASCSFDNSIQIWNY